MQNSSNNIFLSDGKLLTQEAKTYKNFDLEDLPNEKWVDAFEYDGIYEVSSLGRIKSLQREANTRWATVEKRIYEGRTEYECTLNRKQFVRHNLKKAREEKNIIAV